MGTPTLEYDRVKISAVPKLDFSMSSSIDNVGTKAVDFEGSLVS